LPHSPATAHLASRWRSRHFGGSLGIATVVPLMLGLVLVAAACGSGPSAHIASGRAAVRGCSPMYGTFSAANPPPACWRPYAASSPFNRPLPAHPRLQPGSAAIVGRLLGFGPLQNLTVSATGQTDTGARPLYFSSAGDPSFRLHCTAAWGRCPLEGMSVHIPDAAMPAAQGDRHLTVVDQRAGVEYDMWEVHTKPPGGGELTFSWGGRTPIDGNGLGSSAVAAGFGTAAGILRAQELAAGQINHALFLAVKCDSGSVYPATRGGQMCSELGLSNQDAPALGARFQLAMSRRQIRALPVPPWKKTILTAMARYGLIVGDTGGAWAIPKDTDARYRGLDRPNPWLAVAQRAGVPYYGPDMDYVFNLNNGVDWRRYLRVVAPCVSAGHC